MEELPSLYLNENIAVRLTAVLEVFNIKAVHTLNVGNKGVSDEEQLQYAAIHKYILVTHNRNHFKRLHSRWLSENKPHSGIIIVSFAEPERLAARIVAFFEQTYPSLIAPFCVSPPNISNN